MRRQVVSSRGGCAGKGLLSAGALRSVGFVEAQLRGSSVPCEVQGQPLQQEKRFPCPWAWVRCVFPEGGEARVGRGVSCPSTQMREENNPSLQVFAKGVAGLQREVT